MLRIICKQVSIGEAVHVNGGQTYVDFITFDVSIPEVEKYLRETQQWATRTVVGVEILEVPKVGEVRG